jgi:hypothetical protein
VNWNRLPSNAWESRHETFVFPGFSWTAAGSPGSIIHDLLSNPYFAAGVSALHRNQAKNLFGLVGGTMNNFLVGLLTGVFVGVLLAPVFSPEIIALAAIILFVLAVVLMYLFYRGVLDFQDYE